MKRYVHERVKKVQLDAPQIASTRTQLRIHNGLSSHTSYKMYWKASNINCPPSTSVAQQQKAKLISLEWSLIDHILFRLSEIFLILAILVGASPRADASSAWASVTWAAVPENNKSASIKQTVDLKANLFFANVFWWCTTRIYKEMSESIQAYAQCTQNWMLVGEFHVKVQSSQWSTVDPVLICPTQTLLWNTGELARCWPTSGVDFQHCIPRHLLKKGCQSKTTSTVEQVIHDEYTYYVPHFQLS